MPDETPNLADEYADFATYHTLDLLKFSTTLYNETLRALKIIEDGIVAALVSNTSGEGLTKRGLSALLKQVQDLIETNYGEIASNSETAIADIIAHESAANTKFVNDKVAAPIFTRLGRDDVNKAIDGNFIKGLSLEQWWSRQAQDLQDKFTDQMRQGYTNGEGVADLIKRVRGTKQFAYKDGIMNVSKNDADTLVRTAVLGAANESKFQLFQSNKDVVKGIQWMCLSAGTMIETPTGPRAIESIKAGEIVYGGSRNPRHVKQAMKFRKSKMAKVTLSNGAEIICTDDHRFLTKEGEWVMAKDLIYGIALAEIQ
jgi:hypothetical protein